MIFFNFFTVLLFFPFLSSPWRTRLNPVAKPLPALLLKNPTILLILSILLFFALKFLVGGVRRLLSARIEVILERYIFASPFKAFFFGLFFTAFIPSSSVTTSLIIPLVAAGILELLCLVSVKVVPIFLATQLGKLVNKGR